ncbi:MAG: hypothetical protein Tsb0034_25950 [Ekhidna sp.]
MPGVTHGMILFGIHGMVMPGVQHGPGILGGDGIGGGGTAGAGEDTMVQLGADPIGVEVFTQDQFMLLEVNDIEEM